MNKVNVYLCGEEMDEKKVLPKHFEYFFDKKMLFAVLFVLVLFLLMGVAP